MDIVDFTKEAEEREQMIWQCQCGNSAFMIYEDATIECSDCDRVQNECDAHYQVVRKWTRKVRGENR